MAVELGPLDPEFRTTQYERDWVSGQAPDPRAAQVAEARKNFTPEQEAWANTKARLPDNPAESKKSAPTAISWGGRIQKDLRVKLEVPKSYLGGLGGGPAGGPNGRPLAATSGIVFPYTPTVTLNNQATYSSVAPTHSNYTSNAYKNSSVGPISVSGKFTAQNEYEAALILGVQHLLRSLTKMRWGDDPDAGAPPPVCRFFAYGNSMIDNVPVVVTGWKMEYPDSVDYIQVGAGIKDYGNSFVPSVCTISIDLAVQYSRSEQLNFNVTDFLSGKLAGKGYL
jgi:hypothetical protein